MCLSLQAIWIATPVEGGVQLSLTSPDGDQGYPGEVQASVSYTLQVNTPHSSVADHPRSISNIFQLRSALAWRGLLHEPLVMLHEVWSANTMTLKKSLKK